MHTQPLSPEPRSPATPASHSPPATPRAAPLLHTLLLPTTMLLAAMTLAACGGGGGGGSPTGQGPDVANAAAISPARNGEVLSYVKGKLEARGPMGNEQAMFGDMPGWLATAATTSTIVSSTGTVVQEAGVDEEDLIKIDGTRIYTLTPQQAYKGNEFARLEVHNRDASGRLQSLGKKAFAGDPDAYVRTHGMMVAEGGRVAVVGESTVNLRSVPDCGGAEVCIAAILPYIPVKPRVELQLLDASQPASLPNPERLVIDGRLVGTRQIGRLLYMVASHSPAFAYDRLPITSTPAERSNALTQLALSEILPRISVNGAPSVPLVSESDCWIQPANTSMQISVTTITTIDLGSPGFTRNSRCFVGGTEALYMSANSLYLATTRNEVQTLAGRTSFAAEMRTDIHKFSLGGNSVGYRASGSINGHLGWDRAKTSHRLSEHNGDLRVLGYTGSWGWMGPADAATIAPSPATLSVLRERSGDASLQTVATLPNAQRPALIGKAGEQVYGVRFAGDRAYVVTFRQTDPLYVLDLSNPADPRVAGELEIPGFSDWLYPVEGGLLFGVGKDADERGRSQGVKIALFDVSNPAAPKVLESKVFGGPGSSTTLDYTSHGISQRVVNGKTRFALPMQLMPQEVGFGGQVLQRFEIDHASRKMETLAGLGPALEWMNMANLRTLQTEGKLYFLHEGGTLLSYDW